MANKYSRYALNPFPSLYVDDRKIEISQLLAQRYDANKQSHDLIDRTLSQMELLDGDKHHGERVKGEVKDMFKKHIEKGDWENSSLVVQDAANKVQTDQGLIWSNKSFQNRQLEIKAIREANLNGIPMIDFGAQARAGHQSYYFDQATGEYVTNVYEPMSERMLDYRTRKEAMIGKIPADQRGNLRYIGRTKTNKIADLLVEQYIADTHEGKQEYRKLIEVDLPQSIPLEERMKMAKAQIREDFREAAQQQEFKQVTEVKGGGGGTSGKGLPPGITFQSSVSSKVDNRWSEVDDKVRELQNEQKWLINQISVEADPEKKKEYQANFDENAKILDENLQRIANENGIEGQRALDKYNRIKSRLLESDNWSAEDGQKLFQTIQHLTYNTNESDTDWGNVNSKMLIGGSTLATGSAVIGQAGPQALVPEEIITVPTSFLIGGGIGLGTGLIEEWTNNLRNVRDWHRPQEGGYVTGTLGLIDNEREQLQEELWTDQDLNDANVDHINKLLNTNFKESDLEELMKISNAYYTFMVKDGSKAGNDRLTGDELFEKVTTNQFYVNQPTIGFGPTAEGKKLRGVVNDYFKNDFDVTNSGLKSHGMGDEELLKWIDQNDGKEDDNPDISKLQFEYLRLPDIETNTPMKITLGFEKDGLGTSSRDFHITDPTIIQPGGWLYNLVDANMGMGEAAYDEIIRQEYSKNGYNNTTIDNYVSDMSYKKFLFSGGGSEEDLLNITYQMQNNLIKDILLDSSINLKDYPVTNGERGVLNNNGQYVSFTLQDGSFNEAAWQILQSDPNKLAELRKNILQKSMQEFTGYNF
tara:strand:+ start:11401 stop:13839 length:2439 start_codon:yes stop_codon:yes gene_type:complete